MIEFVSEALAARSRAEVGARGAADDRLSSQGNIPLKLHEPAKERLLAEIAERKRVEEQLRAANRTLRTINRCNEALVRATEEIQLVQAICRLLVEDGGMRMAWVGYREEGAARRIRQVAHAGFEDGYLDRVDVSWGDAPTGCRVTVRPCL